MAAILYALELGYVHLDTAQSYGTEAMCGEALRRSGLSRDEVFLTTKIDSSNCWGGRLISSLRASNDTIGIDAVDLTLIHWPVSPAGRMPMAVYLAELAEAQTAGLTRLIGVSNFTIADLDEAEALIGRGQIITNQVERHLYLQNDALVEACKNRGIAVTCYLPLARGACAGDAVVEAIAKAHAATPHQVALAFSLSEGHVVIPTSGKPAHINENFAAKELMLSTEELSRLRRLDRNQRQIRPAWSSYHDPAR